MERKVFTAEDILAADLAEIIRMHRFESSRPYEDGSQPVAPKWNSGCSCGVALYYFEWDDHLSSEMLAYLNAGELLDSTKLSVEHVRALHNSYHSGRRRWSVHQDDFEDNSGTD